MTDVLARAERFVPGASQTLSKAPSRWPSAHPHFAVRGDGAYLYTEDSAKLLDWVGSLGATPLGYRHPTILRAVERQLRHGAIYSLPSVLEGEYAERVCAALHWPEMVKTTMTGTEACMAAVRIARAYTGRDLILTASNGYHGWSDIFTVTKPQHPGVPDVVHDWVDDGQDYLAFPVMGEWIDTFAYNGLAQLKERLYGASVAAVMLEPTLLTPPAPGFLEDVVDVAHNHGGLVIFDEMILGGRLALGGGSEFFGVQPDLATFGKALGGGLPLACVVGKRDVMQHAAVISGTFSGSALSLAAGLAALDVYEHEGVIETLWDHGRAFSAAVRKAAKQYGVPFTALNEACPPHPFLRWTGEGDGVLEMSILAQELAKRSILIHCSGHLNACAAMTVDDVEDTATAFDQIFAGWDRWTLEGEPFQANPFARVTP